MRSGSFALSACGFNSLGGKGLLSLGANECLCRRFQPLLRPAARNILQMAGSRSAQPADAARPRDPTDPILHCSGHWTTWSDRLRRPSTGIPAALATLPTVSIHLGHFLTKTVRMPLAHPVPGGPRTVEVIKTEEKGSDVNLASHLLADAFRGDAEAFVLISNDSDLMEPLRIVRHELGKVVGLLNPQPRQSRAMLRCKPTFVKQLRHGVASLSQFPKELHDKHGAISRPDLW